MPKPILVNDPLVDITSIVDTDQWESYDISSYLNHPDPKLVNVIIQNTTGFQRNVGVRPTGSAISDLYTIIQLTSPDILQFPCSLAGGNTIDLFRPNVGTAGLKYYIHAEVGGDEVVAYDDPIFVQNVSPVGWGTVDSTTRFGADAGRVKASILFIHWIASGVWAYRSFGSTDTGLYANTAESNTFGICGVDKQDRYQTYQSLTGGKIPQWKSFYWEAGYIKKGWNHIVLPVDRNLNVPATWTDEDLTDITEEAAEIALIRYSNIGPVAARQAWMRPDGGSQTPIWIQQTTHRHALVELTASQVYEYYITNANVNQIIVGWYANPGQVLKIDRGTLTIDAGTLTIG